MTKLREKSNILAITNSVNDVCKVLRNILPQGLVNENGYAYECRGHYTGTYTIYQH